MEVDSLLLLREVEQENNDFISFMVGWVVCNFSRKESI